MKRHSSLKSKNAIQALFRARHSVFSYPYKVVYTPSETSQAPKMLFSVGKKNFKRAVDRNHIKRQMREAYRTQAPQLFPEGLPASAIGLIFVGKERLPHPDMTKGMAKALAKLQAVLVQ